MEPKTPRDVIRDFYDEYGWKKDGQTGRSLDDIAHEDQDVRVQRYMADNENRYKSVFSEGGQLFLDAACGGEPRRHLAPGFHRHVCVDLSRVGLAEARDRLGENGFYVLADLSRLPFREETFDGALASHCLYHVAADQQPVVVQEMVRTRSSRWSSGPVTFAVRRAKIVAKATARSDATPRQPQRTNGSAKASFTVKR